MPLLRYMSMLIDSSQPLNPLTLLRYICQRRLLRWVPTNMSMLIDSYVLLIAFHGSLSLPSTSTLSVRRLFGLILLGSHVMVLAVLLDLTLPLEEGLLPRADSSPAREEGRSIPGTTPPLHSVPASHVGCGRPYTSLTWIVSGSISRDRRWSFFTRRFIALYARVSSSSADRSRSLGCISLATLLATSSASLRAASSAAFSMAS